MTSSVAGIFLLLLVVSVSGIGGLLQVERRLETINKKWLAGSQLLGDLNNTVSQFRVVEGYRALDTGHASAIQAEFLSERYAASIGDLISQYEVAVGDERMSDDVQAFREAWQAYLGQHRRWVAATTGVEAGASAGYGSILQRRYEQVELAAQNLIDGAKSAADVEAGAAGRSAHDAKWLVIAMSAMAGMLSLAAIIHVAFRVAKPLGAITNALARLAAGHRDERIPNFGRSDEIGAMASAFEVFQRNAVALAEAQERAEALARHDALTGLPNRRLFGTELETALGRATATGSAFAVMVVDLDRFKPVNDLRGHAAGDVVLCEIASRLKHLMDPGVMLARLGGDEFAIVTVISPDMRAAADNAVQIANRIVAAVNETITLGATEVVLGASIGIALCPFDGGSLEELLHAADLAMYRAKHDGGDTFCFFETSMDEEIRAKAAFEADVRLALDNDEFKPNYQPIIDLKRDRIAGFEALARWHHPVRGFVPPDTFIPIVEQLGLLGQLTRSMFRQAFRDAKQWEPGVHVAVNISPAQLQDKTLPASVASILLSERFPPHRLEIEVTESALLGDLQAAKFTLEALQQLGVKVVLDDFGTGYSSLSHLLELRFDKIKIDRSFIRSVNDDQESRTIVDAVLGLAHNLGLPTVAEGIEDETAMSLLTLRGCEFGQGFLFSKAVSADVARAMLYTGMSSPMRA